MGKVEIKKQHKRETLLMTAYQLFSSKGVSKTSISDIVAQANVAKGTFYLYFKDKYDIRNRIILNQAEKIFDAVNEALAKQGALGFEEKLLFIIDTVIDSFLANSTFLRFAVKNLNWSAFKETLSSLYSRPEIDLSGRFQKMLSDYGITLERPDMLLFLLTELVGGVTYSAVIYGQPADFETVRPYLRRSISAILSAHIR